jgi:hypothetical protein
MAVPDESAISDDLRDVLNIDWNAAEREIEGVFGVPVYMQNEVTAAAGGESLFGAARRLSDYVFFYLGSLLNSRLILNHQIYNSHASFSVDVGLDQLQRELRTYGFSIEEFAKGRDVPDAVGVAYDRWLHVCSDRIADSVKSLLQFVGIKSLIVSTYAPTRVGQEVCAEINKKLTNVTAILGRASPAPKAVGAASLSYHSRFMVQ